MSYSQRGNYSHQHGGDGNSNNDSNSRQPYQRRERDQQPKPEPDEWLRQETVDLGNSDVRHNLPLHAPFPSILLQVVADLRTFTPQSYDASENIPRLARLINDIYDDNSTAVKKFMVMSVLDQPYKMAHHAAVLIILNQLPAPVTSTLEDKTIAADILTEIVANFQELLQTNDWRSIRILSCFFGWLCPHLITPASFVTLNKSLLRILDNQKVSKLECEQAVITVGLSLLCAGPTLIRESLKELDLLVEQIQTFSETVTLETEDLYCPFSKGSVNSQACTYDRLALVCRSLHELQVAGIAAIPPLFPEVSSVLPDLMTETAGPAIDLPEMNLSFLQTPSSSLLPSAHPRFRFALHLADEKTTVELRGSDRCLLDAVICDVIDLYHVNRLEAAKTLISLHRFCRCDAIPSPAALNLHTIVTQTVISSMLQLPTSEHVPMYYSALTTELCKLSPTTVAPPLGKAIQKIYAYLSSGLDVMIMWRFCSWFSNHLANFGLKWAWKDWSGATDLPAGHFQREFICGTFNNEIRLTYYDRVKDTIPEHLKPLFPASAPAFTFLYEDKSNPYNSQTEALLQCLKARESSEDVIRAVETLRISLCDHASAPVVKEEAHLISQDIAAQCLLNLGSRSFSHFLNATERYLPVFRFIASNSEERRSLLQSVSRFWCKNPQMVYIVFDKLLQFRIVDAKEILHWCFNPKHSFFDKEDSNLLQSQDWTDGTKWTILSMCLDKVNGRVNQVQMKVNSLQPARKLAEVKVEDMADNSSMDLDSSESADFKTAKAALVTVTSDQRHVFVKTMELFAEHLLARQENLFVISQLSVREWSTEQWSLWSTFGFFRHFCRVYAPQLSQNAEAIKSIAFATLCKKNSDSRTQSEDMVLDTWNSILRTQAV